MLRNCLCLVLAALLLAHAQASSQCLDPSGSPVDWFFIQKLPDGLQYAYRDPNHLSSSPLSPEQSTLDDSSSPLGRTLTQLYDQKSSFAYVGYNDEIPESVSAQSASLLSQFKPFSSTYAHAKGVLAFDGLTGFWLVHSVPKFPDLSASSYTWEGASTKFGQSFLCLSLNPGNIDHAANQLIVMHPHQYQSNMPSSMANDVPVFASLLNGATTTNTTSIVDLYSLGGNKFTSFAKSKKYGTDIYEYLVEYHYQGGFAWETWRRSPYLSTYCPPNYKYQSVNVLEMSVGSGYRYTQDHSKWGVSLTSTIICIGGINRMQSQRVRGGGTVCFDNAPLHKAVYSSISSTDACS